MRRTAGALLAAMLVLPAPASAAARKVLVRDRAWVTATDGVVLHRMKLEVRAVPLSRDKRFRLIVTAPDNRTLVDRCGRPTAAITLPYAGNGRYRAAMLIDDAKLSDCQSPVERLDTVFDVDAQTGFAKPVAPVAFTDRSFTVWPVRVSDARTYELGVDPKPPFFSPRRAYGPRTVRLG